MMRLARILGAGAATNVGSLPHPDAQEAVEFALATQPRLPAAPQLPAREPVEGMLVQWLRALPEVEVAPDGTFTLRPAAGDPSFGFDADAHGGLLAFVDHLASLDRAPSAVKVQITGPLTLGVALVRAGMDPASAFSRASMVAQGWADAVLDLLRRRLGNSEPVLFVDEPGLVAWREDDPPIPREDAVDVLSGVLAHVDAVTGVHVCGPGDRRMAIEAGPDITGFPVHPSVIDDGVALSRYLEAGGWIAWGAVPTDRPVGEKPDHWWNELVGLWCDLTRGGCDPVALRTQSLVTPACGLASHTVTQARRILAHCVEIGERAREQAVATRLSVGA